MPTALWLVGADAHKAGPALLEALKDDSPNVRLYAAQCLWALRRDREGRV